MKSKPTPEQQARAEERRARLRELWQKVAAMSEEQRAQFAASLPTVTTCDGHPLTVNNTALLAHQADGVSIVGGFQQWKKHGRQVRKGERALGIWIPKTPKADANRPEGMISQADLEIHFIFGSVFDITQTEPIQKQEG